MSAPTPDAVVRPAVSVTQYGTKADDFDHAVELARASLGTSAFYLVDITLTDPDGPYPAGTRYVFRVKA